MAATHLQEGEIVAGVLSERGQDAVSLPEWNSIEDLRARVSRKPLSKSVGALKMVRSAASVLKLSETR